MPFYLREADVFPEVAGLRSVLIVPCRFCPAASLAVREKQPYIQLFRRFLRTKAYESFIRALKQRLEEYEGLLEISVELASSLDLEKVLELAMDRAEKLCRAETSSIWEVDDKAPSVLGEIDRKDLLDLSQSGFGTDVYEAPHVPEDESSEKKLRFDRFLYPEDSVSVTLRLRHPGGPADETQEAVVASEGDIEKVTLNLDGDDWWLGGLTLAVGDVASENDDGTLVAGAPNDDSLLEGAGAAHIYYRSPLATNRGSQ